MIFCSAAPRLQYTLYFCTALLLESLKFTPNITMSILAEYSSHRVLDRRFGMMAHGDIFARRGSIGGGGLSSALPINNPQSIQAVQGLLCTLACTRTVDLRSSTVLYMYSNLCVRTFLEY